jgi:hypothetical protein
MAAKGSEVHGVYMLFKGRKLAYVGRSQNPQQRISAHRSNGRPFDFALHMECPAADVVWVELALIEALNPPQNKVGVVAPRPDEAETPRPIIVREFVQRPLPEPPPVDPRAPLTLSAARWKAHFFHLGREFDDAVRGGTLRSVPKNPEFDRPGSRRLIAHGDLTAWIDARLEERAASGWRVSPASLRS